MRSSTPPAPSFSSFSLDFTASATWAPFSMISTLSPLAAEPVSLLAHRRAQASHQIENEHCLSASLRSLPLTHSLVGERVWREERRRVLHHTGSALFRETVKLNVVIEKQRDMWFEKRIKVSKGQHEGTVASLKTPIGYGRFLKPRKRKIHFWITVAGKLCKHQSALLSIHSVKIWDFRRFFPVSDFQKIQKPMPRNHWDSEIENSNFLGTTYISNAFPSRDPVRDHSGHQCLLNPLSLFRISNQSVLRPITPSASASATTLEVHSSPAKSLSRYQFPPPVTSCFSPLCCIVVCVSEGTRIV